MTATMTRKIKPEKLENNSLSRAKKLSTQTKKDITNIHCALKVYQKLTLSMYLLYSDVQMIKGRFCKINRKKLYCYLKINFFKYLKILHTKTNN